MNPLFYNIKIFIEKFSFTKSALKILRKLNHKIERRSFAARKIINPDLHFKRSNSDKKNILFFTTAKCASSFMNILIPEISKNSQYTHIDYGRAIWVIGNTFNFECEPDKYINQNSDKLFTHKHSLIYGPLREYINIKDIHKYKIIFFLRDPRDVLVSAYYSFGKTHSIPLNKYHAKSLIDERNRISNETIDEYVSRRKSYIKEILNKYIHLAHTHKDFLYLNYDSFAKDQITSLEVF